MEPYEIIMAPYEVYLAVEGTAFPLIDAVPGAGWVLLGKLGKLNQGEEGITVTHNQNVVYKRTAGSTGPVKAVRNEEDMTVGFLLEDMTLEAYAKALNGVAVTDVPAGVGTAGYREITLRQGHAITVYALLCRGVSPYGDGWNAQYQVPRVIQTDNPAPTYSKGGSAALRVLFTALEDHLAATEEERFGKLVTQDADPLP